MYIIDTYLDKDRLPVLEKKELCRETQTLNSPDMTFDFLNRYFRLKDRTEEYIYLLAFDKKCHLIGVFELSHGTVDSSLITSREVFMKALRSFRYHPCTQPSERRCFSLKDGYAGNDKDQRCR